MAGEGVGVDALHLGGGALGDDVAAVLAGAGAEVEQVVGGADRLLVVLDDDDGVAEVAQALEGGDEAWRCRAGAGRWRARRGRRATPTRRGADLGGEADALGFAAGEGGGGAVEREVVEADVLQEAQALFDLAQDQAGDVAVGVGELDLLEPLDRAAGGEGAEVLDAGAGDEHGARLRAQAGAAADGAGAQGHVALDLLAGALGVGLLVTPLEVGDDAFEAGLVRAPPAVAVAVGDLQALAAGAVQEQVAVLLGELLPGGVEVDAVALGDRLGDLGVVVGDAARPRRDRALRDREAGVGDEHLGVDLHLGAEAGAALAGAVGGVEGEDARLELDQGGAVLGAGEALGVDGRALGLAVAVDDLDLHESVCQGNGRLDRVGEALAHVVAHHEPVDDDGDVVLVALVEHDRLLEHAHAIVDLHALEAVGAKLLQQLAVLALAAAHDGGHHHEAGVVCELHRLVDDLLCRLADDRAAADGTVGLAHAGPQQAQVVVDLGDGADGGAGVAGRGLLVDRDRRGEALDGVHVGLVHLAEELAGVRGEGLHVAALALGVDGVEGEARLARPRQPRDHHERVAGKGQRDVLEVVLAGAGDDDLIAGRHARAIVCTRTDVRVRPAGALAHGPARPHQGMSDHQHPQCAVRVGDP